VIHYQYRFLDKSGDVGQETNFRTPAVFNVPALRVLPWEFYSAVLAQKTRMTGLPESGNNRMICAGVNRKTSNKRRVSNKRRSLDARRFEPRVQINAGAFIGYFTVDTISYKVSHR